MAMLEYRINLFLKIASQPGGLDQRARGFLTCCLVPHEQVLDDSIRTPIFLRAAEEESDRYVGISQPLFWPLWKARRQVETVL